MLQYYICRTIHGGFDSGVFQKAYNDTTRINEHNVLRNIVDSPLYIRNADLHRDVQMKMVTNEIREFAKKHEERLLHHDKFEAIHLLDSSELLRRLKRKRLLSWCIDHYKQSTVKCTINTISV